MAVLLFYFKPEGWDCHFDSSLGFIIISQYLEGG